jgi:DNA-directed RNA polymerase subunit RPC12/RpoP
MTSPIKEIGIICPKCRHQFEDWQRLSVNLDLDDFDDAYLDECSSAVCPNCSFKIYFDSLTVKDGIFQFE